jgi:hypothetical protein
MTNDYREGFNAGVEQAAQRAEEDDLALAREIRALLKPVCNPPGQLTLPGIE